MPFAKSEEEWAERVRAYLKLKLKQQGVGYSALAKLMEKQGLQETVPSITNKLARGTFSATFFLGVLRAIGVAEIRIKDV